MASVDITPKYPIRLSGYAARKTESEGVAQRIWAKALAIGSDDEKPALLLAVENVGVPKHVRDDLADRLHRKRGIRPERITVCSTHTHSAPCLEGSLRNLFLDPLPAEQQERIARYTRELKDSLEQAALQALDNRQPARLSRGLGQAVFATNRRPQGGPVDHDLPVLFFHSPNGALRAVLANYACHCTTVTGEFNQVCGDWAGYACEKLEQDNPGAMALVTIGCGGDANPNPRPGFDLAQRHGATLAAAVETVLSNSPAPVSGRLNCRTRQIELPFDTLPTREQLEERAKKQDFPGKHARGNLERLDRGEKLPAELGYLVQVWQFGDGLAMVFLPGEVVVDYSLRLKREFGMPANGAPASSSGNRLWVTAYANDVPCYIPSERVLKEGGYEGEGAMVYYDLPTRFAAGIEDRIVRTVRGLLEAWPDQP